MINRQEVIKRAEALAKQVLPPEGFELVQVHYRRERRGWVLRLFIDRIWPSNDYSGVRPLGSGVTLEDCAQVSREVGRLLDVEEVIPGAYTLEVSSPGAERKLKTREDFKRFVGRKAHVRLRDASLGMSQVEGRIESFSNDVVKLRSEGASEIAVPFEAISSANLCL